MSVRWKVKPLVVIGLAVVLTALYYCLSVYHAETSTLTRPEPLSNDPHPDPDPPESVHPGNPRSVLQEDDNLEEDPTATPTADDDDQLELLVKSPGVAAIKASCNVETGAEGVYKIWCEGNESFVCNSLHPNKECPLQLQKQKRNYNCDNLEDFKLLMEERKRTLKEACTKLGLDKRQTNFEKPRELFHFDAVGPNGLTWCPVYKAGSSNINSYFCPLYYEGRTCRDKHFNGANLWRYSRFYAPKNNNIPRFIMVRNPFERVLSAYRDKIEWLGSLSFLDNIFHKMMAPHRLIPASAVSQKQNLVNSARNKADMKWKGRDVRHDPTNPYESPLYATFPEFVRSILTGNSNEHWNRMTDSCAPCGEYGKLDYILKMDEFDCEFNNMLGSLGSFHLQDVHDESWETNVNPSRTQTDLYRYYGQLSDVELTAFFEWYRDDCVLFGYDCERVVCEVKSWIYQYKPPVI